MTILSTVANQFHARLAATNLCAPGVPAVSAAAPYTCMSGERSFWNDALKLVRDRYHPTVDVHNLSLHTVVETLKKAQDEDALILADYHLLSISGACGNPPTKVAAHREKFFSNLRFRTLREGLNQFDENVNAIL